MNTLTRDRVLAEGARLFAERGFNKVTVREICIAAKANVASVSYHFGDKQGLYAEIVEAGLAGMAGEARKPAELNGGAGAGPGPGDDDAAARLGAFVRVMVQQLLEPAEDAHVHQLLMHEMTDPTPMFDVIAKRVMRPRLSHLCRLVGELMDRPPADRVVVNAAASVQAQCLMAKMTALKTSSIDELADHITRFSLAGIRELSQRQHDK